jgi:hypothetical protein
MDYPNSATLYADCRMLENGFSVHFDRVAAHRFAQGDLPECHLFGDSPFAIVQNRIFRRDSPPGIPAIERECLMAKLDKS